MDIGRITKTKTIEKLKIKGFAIWNKRTERFVEDFLRETREEAELQAYDLGHRAQPLILDEHGSFVYDETYESPYVVLAVWAEEVV